jgi:hypothetical protein
LEIVLGLCDLIGNPGNFCFVRDSNGVPGSKVQIVDFGFVDSTDRGRAAKFSASPGFSLEGLSKFFRYFKLGSLNKFHASLIEDSVVTSFLVAEPEDLCERARLYLLK